MKGGRASALVDGVRLEYVALPGASGPGAAPTLVFLHEGLGCVAMWRGFLEQVAADTGQPVLAYSRQGYGGSDPASLPRPLTYMHHEGRVVLPALLDLLGVERAILVGHSDGASIALVAASSVLGAGLVQGLVLLAPHVICEDLSVSSIREARAAFVSGDLRRRLARYHGANTDVAFWGWNDAWLDPGFRAWTIEDCLPGIRVPVLAIQGSDDPYGTLAQLDLIERHVAGPCERLVLSGCGHDPAREATRETRTAIQAFTAALLRPGPSGP